MKCARLSAFVIHERYEPTNYTLRIVRTKKIVGYALTARSLFVQQLSQLYSVLCFLPATAGIEAAAAARSRLLSLVGSPLDARAPGARRGACSHRQMGCE